jgi:hypothetical protein
MGWVYEIAFTGDRALAEPLWLRLNDTLVREWSRLPGLTALDIYRAIDDAARDPFNDDKDGPLLLAVPEFATAAQLAAARPAIEQALTALPAGVDVTVSALERKFYPVGEEASPAPLSAPFSYVVRYHRPAEDEAAFIANYIATHPGTLAKLPHIRTVMCYFPIAGFEPDRFPAANYMIGNEVVFDSVEHFNAAMQSPVRQELRAHFHAFPKFTGLNTHYPMDRVRVVG